MDQTTANPAPILRKRRAIIATLAAAVLLGACGTNSADDTADTAEPATSAPKPAGAKENAIASASGSIPILVSPSTALSGQTLNVVCFDLYVAGKTTPCAENTIGPGGGVIFYDAVLRAGGVQPWGRFLEMSRWNWNPLWTADSYQDCTGGCGADPASVLKPRENGTQDAPYFPSGWQLCSRRSGYLGGTAANTGEQIGTGRANTAALISDPACLETEDRSVIKLVAEYRGGGLADWFLPSRDELVALCRFGNRNGVGGFIAGGQYASSSTETGDWTVWDVGFDNCKSVMRSAYPREERDYNVRPIRAF